MDFVRSTTRATRSAGAMQAAAVLAVALTFGTALVSSRASADEPASTALPRVVVSGAMIQTDGMLNKPAARKLRRATVSPRANARAADTSGSWLIDYVGRLLDTEPAIARRSRGGTKSAAPARLPAAHATTLAATPNPGKAVTQPEAPTSPITTGTTVPVRPDAPATDQAEQIVMAAERFQARADLVKLEFAARTYDERKLSGQQVFELRSDWRVLERARDALAGAELASAVAAGFEANAYINETTKTIVVAVAGSQDLRRDFITADIWQALIKSEAPQQFYLAKTYVRSVIQRYQMRGFTTECVGHSLGGGACAYAAAELGIRAVVLNPISAGKLPAAAHFLITNYIVDGDIANLIYGARGREFPGTVQVVSDGRDVLRLMALEKYGQLAGPILVVRELAAGIGSHKVDHALDLVAAQAEVARPR